MTCFWLLSGLSLAVALVLTRFIRRYAVSRSLLDMPNARSSHTVPTPRGGGAAIVVTYLFGLVALAVAGVLPLPVLLALLGGGGWVALVGWLDDVRDISPHLRLGAHFIGAAWALACLGGLPPLPGIPPGMGAAVNALAAVYLVWLLNLYNFMDGIDGIAGIEAITVCLGGAVLYAVTAPGETAWMLPVLLIASVAGFLYWNFPAAAIFMGDAGSGFLGFVLGVFSIQAAWAAPELFWGWVILLGAFVADATVTLLRRAVHGIKVYEAHRSHAYQHAARRYGSHAPVSIAFGAINLLWLLPVAVLTVTSTLNPLAGIALAYAPLVLAALLLGSGNDQPA